MPNANIKLLYTIDANVLAKQISNLVGTILNPQDFKREGKDGGVLFSYTKGDYVIGAYNHPTRNHTVTVKAGFLINVQKIKSSARSGVWAIAWLNRGPSNRKVEYGFS